MNLNEAVELAKEYLGHEYFKAINIDYKQDDNVLSVNIKRDNENVNIVYNKKTDLFRAFTYIKEHNNENSYEVSLKGHFSTNGHMLDCSRNGVVRIEQIKEIILIQALMGQNRLLLYTEDTYEVPEYPYFGYLRGSYSKEDLKEIVNYGNTFGVELVPCIQTLDHLERAFRWDPFNDIKEGPGSSNIMPNNEEGYKFIETMLKTCRECFTTTAIHIGMDESFRMGLNKYLNKYGYSDRVSLFCNHLKKVIEICNKYDFKPMIWSDMFFRLNDENGEYYGGNKLPQSTLDLIPEGIELVYWDYYHDQKEIYDRMIQSHLDTNRVTHFAGGAWRWTGFAPAVQKSFEFHKLALESAQEHNLKNVFSTAWGDNGNECSIYPSLLAIAQYSCFNYYDSPSIEKINSLLEAVTGETVDRMFDLDLPNMPGNKVLAPMYNPSKFFLYQDVLLGLFDSQVKEEYSINYAAHALQLHKDAKESKKYSYMYENLALLCEILINKVNIGVKLRKAYKESNRSAMEEIVNIILPKIIYEVSKFRDSYEKQWMRENRAFGFDVIDGRLGYLMQRLRTAQKVVLDYLEGKIKTIEQLEKDILPFNGYDYEICWNDWSSTVAL